MEKETIQAREDIQFLEGRLEGLQAEIERMRESHANELNEQRKKHQKEVDELKTQLNSEQGKSGSPDSILSLANYSSSAYQQILNEILEMKDRIYANSDDSEGRHDHREWLIQVQIHAMKELLQERDLLYSKCSKSLKDAKDESQDGLSALGAPSVRLPPRGSNVTPDHQMKRKLRKELTCDKPLSMQIYPAHEGSDIQLPSSRTNRESLSGLACLPPPPAMHALKVDTPSKGSAIFSVRLAETSFKKEARTSGDVIHYALGQENVDSNQAGGTLRSTLGKENLLALNSVLNREMSEKCLASAKSSLGMSGLDGLKPPGEGKEEFLRRISALSNTHTSSASKLLGTLTSGRSELGASRKKEKSISKQSSILNVSSPRNKSQSRRTSGPKDLDLFKKQGTLINEIREKLGGNVSIIGKLMKKRDESKSTILPDRAQQEHKFNPTTYQRVLQHAVSTSKLGNKP
jgi:hypothetical protein